MIAGAPTTFGFIDAWVTAMGRASLEGAVAIALVWVVCRCVPRLSPNVRCWLWRLALLKMVLAAMPLGSLDVPVLPHTWTTGQAASATEDTTVADADEAASEAASGPDVGWVERSEPHQDIVSPGWSSAASPTKAA
jgi:hypothetical protein